MTDGNQSTVISQMWIDQNNAKGVIVKPASNQSLSLNVYRSGNWPCTVYSISDNSYEDYILNSPSYGNNLCQFRLTYRNNYALTASNTSAPQKFSRGSGYIATWTSSTGANSQKWYYTTPNWIWVQIRNTIVRAQGLCNSFLIASFLISFRIVIHSSPKIPKHMICIYTLWYGFHHENVYLHYS